MDIDKAIRTGTRTGKKLGRTFSKNVAKWELARALQKLPGWDLDDGLELVGLQRRRRGGSRFIEALGFLAAGALVGTAIGLLIAPRSGKELLRTLAEKGPSGLMGAQAPTNGSRGTQGLGKG